MRSERDNREETLKNSKERKKKKSERERGGL